MTDLVKRKLNKRDATRLNKQIKSKIDEVESLLVEFVEGEGWLSLGYETAWDWWNTEIGERRVGGAARDAVILQIAHEQEGKSQSERVGQRAIGKAVGVDQATVSRVVGSDADASLVDLPESPDQGESEIIDVEIVEDRPLDLTSEVKKHFPPKEPLESTSEDANKWIPEHFRLINQEIDNVRDWLDLSTEQLKKEIREELAIIRDKIQRIEEML